MNASEAPAPTPRLHQLSQLIGKIYLWYLGLLPAMATFAVLWAYGYAWFFCLFIGGVAGVGVYLATVMSYTPLPQSLPWLLLALLDGPIFALLALRNNFHPLAFAIEGYFIDGSAIWLAILFLACVSPLPTRGQRVASIAIMLAVLGLMGSLFWPYWQTYLWGSGERVFWLCLGIAQTTGLNWGRFRRAAVRRQESEGGMLFIVGGLIAWLVALMVGGNLHAAEVALPF